MATGEGYSEPVWIDIDQLDPRPAIEMRASTDEDAIDDYAENFDRLPPIKVAVDSDGKHWTVDGSYRTRAAIRLKKGQIKCVIKKGTYVEAFAEASLANAMNGVRITNADKRKRLEVALRHPVMGAWPSRQIAEHCGIHWTTVTKLRPQIDVGNLHPGTVKGKDGKTYPTRHKPRSPKCDGPANGGGVDAPASPDTNSRMGPPADSPVALKAPPPPGPAPDDEGPEFDVDSEWASAEAAIRRQFEAWPEDVRSIYAFRLRKLGESMIRACPDVTHETVSLA